MRLRRLHWASWLWPARASPSRPPLPGRRAQSPLSQCRRKAMSSRPARSPLSPQATSAAALMKDSALPDHTQVGSTEAGSNAAESTPETSAAIDAQRPAEGPNAMAVATTADMPALASAATASALTAFRAAGLEPVPSGLVRPDGTPIAKISTNSADSTSSGRSAKAARGGGSDVWYQGRPCKAAGQEDRLVGDARCQQKVRKNNCRKEREGHGRSNGRGSGASPDPSPTYEPLDDYRCHYRAVTGVSLKECPVCGHGHMIFLEALPKLNGRGCFQDTS